MKKKVKVTKKKVDKSLKPETTAFIAIYNDGYGSRKKWHLCGDDIHATAQKARDCGCSGYDSEDVGVLEIKIVAQHNAETTFVKQDKISIKFND